MVQRIGDVLTKKQKIAEINEWLSTTRKERREIAIRQQEELANKIELDKLHHPDPKPLSYIDINQRSFFANKSGRQSARSKSRLQERSTS